MEPNTPVFPSSNTVPPRSIPTPMLSRDLFSQINRVINTNIPEVGKEERSRIFDIAKELVANSHFKNTDTLEQSLEMVAQMTSAAMLRPELKVQVVYATVLTLNTPEGNHFRQQYLKKLDDLGYHDFTHALYRTMPWKASGYNRLFPDSATSNDPGMYDLVMQFHTGLVENEASQKKLFSKTYELTVWEDVVNWLRATIVLLAKGEFPPTMAFNFLDTKLQESNHELAKEVAKFLGEYRVTQRDLANPPTLEGFMTNLQNTYRGMFLAWVKPARTARMTTSNGLPNTEKLNALIEAQRSDAQVRRPVKQDKCAYCKQSGHFWVSCHELVKDREEGKLKSGWVDRA